MKLKINFLLLIIILLTSFYSLYSQTIRPIRDNVGFCWNAEEMNQFMNYLSKEDHARSADQSKNLFAAISVHDDYLYAGNIYYPLYKNIKTKEVVIFSVTHGTVRKEMGPLSNIIILDEFDKWHGPYNDVEISPLREIIKSELPKEDFIVSNKAHEIEHSIEALVPFLQYYNRDIKITPIMITQMSYEKMDGITDRLSKIILNYMKEKNLKPGKDIFFLTSNDANHYGEDFNNSPYGMDAVAHKTATENDMKIILKGLVSEVTTEKIKNTANDLWPDPENKKVVPLWCGRYPIVFGLQTILKVAEDLDNKKVYGTLFKYSDTFTEKVLPVKNTSMGLTAVFSYKHWCAWFTEGFYLK